MRSRGPWKNYCIQAVQRAVLTVNDCLRSPDYCDGVAKRFSYSHPNIRGLNSIVHFFPDGRVRVEMPWWDESRLPSPSLAGVATQFSFKDFSKWTVSSEGMKQSISFDQVGSSHSGPCFVLMFHKNNVCAIERGLSSLLDPVVNRSASVPAVPAPVVTERELLEINFLYGLLAFVPAGIESGVYVTPSSQSGAAMENVCRTGERLGYLVSDGGGYRAAASHSLPDQVCYLRRVFDVAAPKSSPDGRVGIAEVGFFAFSIPCVRERYQALYRQLYDSAYMRSDDRRRFFNPSTVGGRLSGSGVVGVSTAFSEDVFSAWRDSMSSKVMELDNASLKSMQEFCARIRIRAAGLGVEFGALPRYLGEFHTLVAVDSPDYAALFNKVCSVGVRFCPLASSEATGRAESVMYWLDGQVFEWLDGMVRDEIARRTLSPGEYERYGDRQLVEVLNSVGADLDVDDRSFADQVLHVASDATSARYL